jgi:hypothetical protein
MRAAMRDDDLSIHFIMIKVATPTVLRRLTVTDPQMLPANDGLTLVIERVSFQGTPIRARCFGLIRSKLVVRENAASVLVASCFEPGQILFDQQSHEHIGLLGATKIRRLLCGLERRTQYHEAMGIVCSERFEDLEQATHSRLLFALSWR